MRWFLTLLFIAMLILTSAAEQFEQGDWSGREALKTVTDPLPGPASSAARGYWEQFEGRGNWTTPRSLREYRRYRHGWAVVGSAQVAQLSQDLSSSDPWERYVAAVLLGGTHSPEALAPLRRRLTVEKHLDVGYALEGALAELGDETTARLRRLSEAEFRHRQEQGRSAEFRSSYLIRLVCNVHRPEVVDLALNLKSDDGGVAEVKMAAIQHMMADLTGTPRCVSKARKVEVGRFHSTYRYPQLRGMAYARLQEEINQKLADAFGPSPFQWEDEYYEVRDFEVTRLDVDCISVVYHTSGKLRGAGSHNRTCAARNIDLHTGRDFGLDGVLCGDYMDALRRVARPLAERQFEFQMHPDFLSKPPRFYLTPKKLVLLDIFDDELPTELPIPIELLREVVNPDGPMAMVPPLERQGVRGADLDSFSSNSFASIMESR